MGYDLDECFFCYMNGFGNNPCDDDDDDDSDDFDHACCASCMNAAGERSYRVSSLVERRGEFYKECEFCGKTSYCRMLTVCGPCLESNQKTRVPPANLCLVCSFNGTEPRCADCYYEFSCNTFANFCSKCMVGYFEGYRLVSSDNSVLEAFVKGCVNFDMVEKCDYCEEYSAFRFAQCCSHSDILHEAPVTVSVFDFPVTSSAGEAPVNVSDTSSAAAAGV